MFCKNKNSLKAPKQREIRISFHKNFNILKASEKPILCNKKTQFSNLENCVRAF
jgi:hypothetical protein